MLELNKIYNEDCESGMKNINNNTIQLIVTSPPYIDMKEYGYENSKIASEDYVEWLRPKIKEMYRILDDTGSFVLNIKDKPENKVRNPFIFYTIPMILNEGFLLYDTVIWDKMKSFIMPDKSRLSDQFEFIFWFVKSRNYKIIFPDEIRVPVSEGTIKRRKNTCHGKDMSNLPLTKIPSTILRFSSLTKFKEHPAAYPEELPNFFVHCCTNKNDIVVDPFIGSGTTAKVTKEIGRNFIGFELNKEYINLSNQRLQNVN